MLTMNDWLNIFEHQHNCKIYIWCDVKIAQAVGLDFNRQIHRHSICNYIKSCDAGFLNCLKCKRTVENLCVKRGDIEGYCTNGCYEFISPVFYNKKHVATIYVGNLTLDKENSYKKLSAAAKKYKLDPEQISKICDELEVVTDTAHYRQLARAINELFTNILQKQPALSLTSTPPLVEMLLSYIQNNPDSNISLKNISLEYNVHEKYLGRLFKRHVGTSFSEYRNHFRLLRAAELIKKGNRKIIDIALDVGYENVTYFNRLFYREYNMTPHDYREQFKKR